MEIVKFFPSLENNGPSPRGEGPFEGTPEKGGNLILRPSR